MENKVEEEIVLEENLEGLPKTEEKEEQPKRVLKNIVMVAIGNMFTILAGVLVGFLIPKMMVNGDTNIDYGYYKIYTLYFGYIGLFHFGFCDGVLLLYAGKNFEDLDKERFRCFTKFFLVFQTLVALVILLIALPFIKTEYGFIFAFIAINLLAGNITEYYQQICQATGRFKELSLRNIIKATMNSIIIVVLYILFKTNTLSYLQYH